MANDISNRLSRDESNRAAELGIPPPAYRRGRSGGRRRFAIIAVALGAILLVLVGAWSLGRHSSHDVPVIAAQSGPVRVKPENPGGMQVAGSDESILSGKAENGKAALAPPPETPEPQALRAQEQPAPGAHATPGQTAAQSTTAAQPAAPLAPARRETGQAHQPAAPAAAPAAQAGKSPPLAATSERSAPAERSAEVQLAAVGSERAAKLEWGRLTKRMPGLFDGRRPAFVRAERDGRVFWRLRLGGFADTAQATSFCERVRAKGGGCSLASF